MKKENDVLVLEKSFNFGIIFVVLFVLLIVGGCFYYYTKFSNNPAYIIKSSMKKVLEKNEVDEIDLNKALNIQGSIDFDIKANDSEMQKSLDVFNEVDILYNVETMLKDKVFNLELNSKYKNNKLINAKLYNDKSNIYLFLEDFYDKYLKVSKEEVINNSSDKKLDITKDDIKKLSKGLMEVISKTFTEDDFNREKEEIMFNDEKVEVYKNYIVYNKDNFKEINERFVKNVKENKELLEVLKKVSSEKEVEKALNDILNIKDIGNFEMEFIVYTKGLTNKFVKLLLKVKKDSDYAIIEVDNEDVFTISLIEDEVDMKLTIQKNDQNNYVANLGLIIEDEVNANVKMSFIYKNIDNIEKINDKNSVLIDELSEDDLNEIMENFNKNDTIKQFVNDLNSANDVLM